MTAAPSIASPACPLCAGGDVRVFLDGDCEALDASMLGSGRKVIAPGRILRCRNCGFGFRQSRFTDGELSELYRAMDPQVYQAELPGRRRTAKRHLAIVQRYVSVGAILDVGCASGLFLTLAAEARFDSTGIEPSDALRSQAQAALGGKCRILGGTLEKSPLQPASFDAVTLWDVLEHIPDPLAMLGKCRDLLKPGGYLFLNVPDLDSLQARILGRRWPLLLAEHLNYFNRPSLELCGRKAGLKLVRFGRRRAFFSLDYLFYRLSQHSIPGTALGRRIVRSVAARLVIPVSLGETYAVWQRDNNVNHLCRNRDSRGFQSIRDSSTSSM